MNAVIVSAVIVGAGAALAVAAGVVIGYELARARRERAAWRAWFRWAA